MNWVVAGRKMPSCSAAGISSAARRTSCVAVTVWALRPACAVEQTEQTWCDAVEFSGCAWTACTTPIANTRAIESTHSTLPKEPRFEIARTMTLVKTTPKALNDSSSDAGP